MSKNKKPLVFVAMSGGVDSSVAACLLQEQGYEVVGITLKLWEYDEVGGNIFRESICCSVETINDARNVCDRIGAKHWVFDFKEEFKHNVISNFVDEYKSGRTPFPCIICNRKVKWEILGEKVFPLGAEFLATGHYARIKFDEKTGRYQILKANDLSRDQSYVLWSLSQKDLSKTLFPLGELTKTQVRELAKKYNLKTANKPDSQELCFVPDNDYERFFKEWENGNSVKPGPIYNLKNEKMGEHQGIPFYTIGQRKGFGKGFGKPMYVAKIEPKENAIYIAEDNALWKKAFTVNQLNWVSISRPEKIIKCQVKIRNQHQPALATLSVLDENRIKIEFDKPERAITPGQSAVFYDGEILLGGGIIEKVDE